MPTNNAIAESNSDGPATRVDLGGGMETATNGAPPFAHELLNALQAANGRDFSAGVVVHQAGVVGKIGVTLNENTAAHQPMPQQLEQVRHDVRRDGNIRRRVRFRISRGGGGETEGAINRLIDDLLWPTTEVTRAIAAVAQGDLLQTVQLTVDGRPLKGEFLRSATIVNKMIQQLNVFTSE